MNWRFNKSVHEKLLIFSFSGTIPILVEFFFQGEGVGGGGGMQRNTLAGTQLSKVKTSYNTLHFMTWNMVN